MKDYKYFFFICSFTLLIFLSACNSSNASVQSSKEDLKICPQCHMEVTHTNLHTAILKQDNRLHYFDDVGCMVIWLSKNNIDIEEVTIKVFSNDTNKYVEASGAYYKINEKTPMLYGFSAYENYQENSIPLNEVILKMLRGEHMANPKIRKQILGY
ncbi:hypothetical protein KKG72_07925 [bacterium]|nr:hypothetical protein [bacterium]MBU1994562.1 hypothetical protein [bacterium]